MTHDYDSEEWQRAAWEAADAWEAAAEAVAKAREAVVEAARLEVAGGDGPPIWQSVVALEEAECAEAVARARLEALR